MSNVMFGGGGSGSGDIVGPGSSTDNAVARWDGTGGTTLQNSAVTITDGGGMQNLSFIELNVGASILEFSTDGTLSANSDAKLVTEKAIKTYVSTSTPPREFFFDAAALQSLETNYGDLAKLAGTNVNVFVRSYDPSTEQYNNGKIDLPSDLNTAGTVTFTAKVSAATAAASKNVGLTFGHLALTDGEDWDPTSPYTEKDSGAVAISATQDDITVVSWTETVANLGWAADDLVLFRLSRDVSVSDNLASAMYLFSLKISVPLG